MVTKKKSPAAVAVLDAPKVVQILGANGLSLQQETLTTATLRFRGLPCVGPKAEAAFKTPIKYILGLDWEGNPRQIASCDDLSKLHDDWFQPNDKGSAAFMAFGDKGLPVFTAAKFEGDPNSLEPLARGPHYHFDDESFVK